MTGKGKEQNGYFIKLLEKQLCQCSLVFDKNNNKQVIHNAGPNCHIVRVKTSTQKGWGRMLVCDKCFDKLKNEGLFIKDDTTQVLLEQWAETYIGGFQMPDKEPEQNEYFLKYVTKDRFGSHEKIAFIYAKTGKDAFHKAKENEDNEYLYLQDIRRL